MPLTFEQRFDTAMGAIQQGDVDLLAKTLTDPQAITITEQRSVAERLGVKGGLLSAFVNIVADPTVWIAFLMSRKFPTSAWLRGTIPQRHIGAAAEFSGLSYFARPIESFFRGTTVPKLTSLSMRRHAEVMKVGQDIFKDFNRPGWAQEMPVVSLLLEGQNPAGATAELRAVAARMRGDMDQLWGFLGRTKRIVGGFGDAQITPARAIDLVGPKRPRYLRDYLPHMPLSGREAIMEIDGVEALRRMGRGRFAQAMQLKGFKAQDIWQPSEAQSLASDFTRFQTFMNSVGHQMNPRMFRRQRHGIPLESQLGHELFVTDLNIVLPKYVESVARTYAINAPISAFEQRLATTFYTAADGSTRSRIPTREPIIVQTINEGIRASGARMARQQVPGTPHFHDVVLPGSVNTPMMSALQRLVRSLQGKAGDDEILFGNLFSSMGARLDSMRGVLTNKQVNQADAAMKAFERTASYRERVNGVASFFYATTIGLNPFSAMQNLLQPVLTTAPAIGIGPTLAGYRVLAERVPRYMREVAKQHRVLRGNRNVGVTFRLNEATHRAFRETFPELAREGIKVDPRLFEIDESVLLGRSRGLFGTRFFKDRDQYYRAVLQPFTHTEMSNQIITFYGAKQAMRQAIRAGEFPLPKRVAPWELNEFLDFEAGLVVNATQFRPGPGSRSMAQSFLPAPLRQFTTFPTRLFNYFTESTVRGAMSNAQMEQTSIFNVLAGGQAGRMARTKVASLGTGRNLGTIARSFLYGKMAVHGARETLGVDLGGVLGVAAPFNLAPGNQPFAPLPIPPAPMVVYGVISAATTGDIKRLQPLELPYVGSIPIPKTLIPGGIALTRAARAFNQFRPDVGGFVDENERLMYRANTSDLALAMLGLPLDKNRRVRDVMERVQANRGRIRQFRRAYAVAAINFDTSEMGRLSGLWRRRFPDMPALAISPKDLRRYRANARIPMVQRMLQTVGRGARRVVFDYDVDADLLAPPEIPENVLAGAR